MAERGALPVAATPLSTIEGQLSVPHKHTGSTGFEGDARLEIDAPAGLGPRTSAEGSQLIRGAATRVITYATIVLISVLTTAVITRDLGVGQFGRYMTIITVTTLIALVTDSGMTNLATREYALLDGEHRDQTLSALLGMRIALTLLGTVFALGFAFAAHYDLVLILGMLASVLSTFPLIFFHTLSIPLMNDLRLGTLSMLELVRQVIWAVLIIALALLRAGVLPLLVTAVVGNFALVPITARVVGGMPVSLIRIRFAGWRVLLGATLVFSVATAVGTTYLYGTQLITSLVTNQHQAGLYSLVFRVFVVTTTVPTLVGGAAVPFLARTGRAGLDRLSYVLRRYLEVSVVAGIGAALMLCAASGFIIPIVGGGHFRAAIPVAEVQAFALVGTFAASPCSYGLLMLHLYRRLLVANLSALVVMVVVTTLLAHAHGATGAAISSICGEATVAVLMLAGLLRERPESRPSYAFVVKLLLVSAACAVLAAESWLPSLARTVVVAVVYIAAVLLTRALPQEVIDALPLPRRGERPAAG